MDVLVAPGLFEEYISMIRGMPQRRPLVLLFSDVQRHLEEVLGVMRRIGYGSTTVSGNGGQAADGQPSVDLHFRVYSPPPPLVRADAGSADAVEGIFDEEDSELADASARSSSGSEVDSATTIVGEARVRWHRVSLSIMQDLRHQGAPDPRRAKSF